MKVEGRTKSLYYVSAVAKAYRQAIDEARQNPAADLHTVHIRHIDIQKDQIRLYRQFAGNARLLAAAGENKRVEVIYFNASELAAEDIVFESEDAATPEQKRETLLKLFEAGLLTDEDGKLSGENRCRILEAFGFGSYENARDISALHIAKAEGENLRLRAADAGTEPDEYDDHALHIAEHTRFLLSEELGKTVPAAMKKRILAHIRAHREKQKIQPGAGQG